jgi:hypothetical protein
MASAQNASDLAAKQHPTGAFANAGKSVRAGLVYQAVGLNDHLKVALSEAGVNVVVETLANALSLDAIRAALVDVFVVNLDPELEDHLDELTDMLDKMRCPVIFNDGAASSSLGGWDQARWARHLAAKIKGELDSTPPRPSDAGYIPVPIAVPVVKTPAPVVKHDAKQPSLPPVAAAPIVLAAAPVVFATAPAVVAQAPADNFGELDFDFDALVDAAKADAPMQFAAAEDDGMEGFDASAFDLPTTNNDGAFNQADELSDLDALFAETSPTAQSDLPQITNTTLATDILPASLDATPLSWSLEPLDGEAPFVPPTGRAVFGAKDVPPVVMPKPTTASAAAAAPIAAPKAELEDFDSFLSSLAATDSAAEADNAPPSSASSQVGAITKQLPAVTLPVAVTPEKVTPEVKPENFPVGLFAKANKLSQIDTSEFDALFSDLNDLTPVVMSSDAEFSPQATGFDASFDDSGLDFDMDFEVGAPSSSAPSSVASDDDFADLDSLFADPPAVADVPRAEAGVKSPVSPVQTGPERVFVLGASIGGPEAVRTFLSKLKPKTPAAFILAQHMGAEFLELMTSQLAKASALPVRLAKPGESFAAGEIVVVPVSQRFMVDNASVIQFSALPTESPYSPSIDQVMIDMADRFGARCTGIIFSGMASDAIEGAKYLAARGAKVWVQDPATCVISSMIDGAQAAGVVSFVGAPEQLADHVLDDLGMLT